MDVDEERRKIAWFIKCGLTVLVAILAIAAVVQAGKVIIATAGVGGRMKEKELPIYCVETEKTQVALSFDAAWGNGKVCYTQKEEHPLTYIIKNSYAAT